MSNATTAPEPALHDPALHDPVEALLEAHVRRGGRRGAAMVEALRYVQRNPGCSRGDVARWLARVRGGYPSHARNVVSRCTSAGLLAVDRSGPTHRLTLAE